MAKQLEWFTETNEVDTTSLDERWQGLFNGSGLANGLMCLQQSRNKPAFSKDSRYLPNLRSPNFFRSHLSILTFFGTVFLDVSLPMNSCPFPG